MTEPNPENSESKEERRERRREERRNRAPVWGIFLLFLGVVFLLQTLNILPWGLWSELWRFWPLLIIVAGVSILLRHVNAWLVSLLILAILGAGLGIALWQYGTLPRLGTSTFSQQVGDITRAEISIDFAAGNMVAGNLPAGSPDLVEINSTSATGDAVRADFRGQNGTGILSLRTPQAREPLNSGVNWQANFNTGIPLTMNIKMAAGDAKLDFSKLRLSDLQLDLNAGNCSLLVPSAGASNVSLQANVANVTVSIPDGVAAKILAKANLAAVDVDTSRFPRQGDYYVSPGYDTAANRVSLDIETNVGHVAVK